MNTTISTKQLRQNFNAVLDAMASGQTLTLLYRSRPLAEIKPIPRTQPIGRAFTAAQINRWLKKDSLTPQEEADINALINRLP
jgi:antitoxin (DNA-binding transcriptional repressor) of toxin-antitoxin stability system